MKVSIEWLRQYVEIDIEHEQLAERLSDAGFNLEEIIRHGDDVVLDLEVTSNRPDCLGHIGVAREIAVLLNKPLTLPEPQPVESGQHAGEMCTVRIDDTNLCDVYTARIIENVHVGPSPDWLVRRLEAVGLRSVSNVVDVTNYVMMEACQPLHAFDYDKLHDHAIIVRRAAKGETITAIDGSTHQLDDANLVIADSSRPVAVAGVMGGLDTEVSDSTTTILLESASFAPLSIRHTARKLNLHSPSSYRFERGVNVHGVNWASMRAAELLAQVCGGTCAAGVVGVLPSAHKPATVPLRIDRIRHVTGIDVPKKQAGTILQRLGFTIVDDTGEQIEVAVPAHRRDVTREIDLIEEVARIVGFGTIAVEPVIRIEAVPASKLEIVTAQVGQALNACGYHEAMCVSFVDENDATLFADDSDGQVLRVQDANRRANNALRTSTLPSLLRSRLVNQNAGVDRSDLFEISRVFAGRSGAINEQRRLGLLCCGEFRELRGAIEEVFDVLHSEQPLIFEPDERPWYEPDISATIRLADRQIGHAGCITRQIAERFDLREAVCMAEIDFEAIMAIPVQPTAFDELPRFPAIDRDLSLIVDEAIRWGQIRQSIDSQNIPELEDVRFKELFRGRQVPEGKKSLFMSLRYRSDAGSLTHELIDEYQQRILTALGDQHGIRLRDQ